MKAHYDIDSGMIQMVFNFGAGTGQATQLVRIGTGSILTDDEFIGCVGLALVLGPSPASVNRRARRGKHKRKLISLCNSGKPSSSPQSFCSWPSARCSGCGTKSSAWPKTAGPTPRKRQGFRVGLK